LTTIKQLQDEGHEISCFEKNADIGGIWCRTSDDGNQMKVFDSLILTISIKLMAFSDFMPKGPRVFYTHSQYFAYLTAYADHFGLRKHISFKTAVEAVEKTSDGRWEVSVKSDGERDGRVHVFDAVAVCTGSFNVPNFDVTDIDKFSGEVLHSYKYRNNRSFQGKRVLVVGLAESGADLVREVSDVASECTLSIRQRSLLLSRLRNGRYSTDGGTNRAHHHALWGIGSSDVPYPTESFRGREGRATSGVRPVTAE
jgi:cation diffusion facilitator CzcD-associated flavoprotein CzcO